MPDERPPYFAWTNDTANPPRVEAGPKYDGPAVFIATPAPPQKVSESERGQRQAGTPEQEAYAEARLQIEGMGKQMIVIPCPDAARAVAQQELDRKGAPPPWQPDPELAKRLAEQLAAAAKDDPFVDLQLRAELHDALEKRAGIDATPEQVDKAYERFRNEAENVQLEKDMGIDPPPDDLGLGVVPEPTRPGSSPAGVAAITPEEQARIDAFRQYVQERKDLKPENNPRPEQKLGPAHLAQRASPGSIRDAQNATPRLRRGRVARPETPVLGKKLSPAQSQRDKERNMRGKK